MYLSSSIGVDFVKFGLHVFNGPANPLFNRGLDFLRSKLFFGDSIVVSGVNPIEKKIGKLRDPQVAVFL